MGADHPFVAALRPVAKALGATVVSPRRLRDGDIPLEWDGELVAGMRLADLHEALPRLVDRIEAELGARLPELPREDKQRAVRLLEDGGAFQLRGSVEQVADLMGVSRITVYNYLNALRERS